jgi:phospholipase C
MGWKEEIRHVVVLMLENQSFDRLLGFVRLPDPSEQLDGVRGDESVPAAPGGQSPVVRLRRATTPDAYVTDPCPGHQLEDATEQLFGQEHVPDPPTPTMNGFVLNYAKQPGEHGRPIGGERGAGIMECLDPALVPVISTLATNFVVCDRWFSSVPGPTWPNRFFAHAGTSSSVIDSPTDAQQIEGFLGTRFRMRSIYENLAQANRTWAVYFEDHAQAFALRNLHRFANDCFRRHDAFAADVAADHLPDYSFVEPVYMDGPDSHASDEHPPHHLLEGERFIAWVYDTLRSNPAVWERSLLVVLYDEHGGFYDHVPPPATVPPDDASAANAKFKFDRLGVRVPALLVSPWARKGHADHRTYDHTSLLATIKMLFGLPQFLTRRDAQANTFDESDFLDAPRAAADLPLNLLSLVPARPAAASRLGRGFSDLEQSLLALSTTLGKAGVGPFQGGATDGPGTRFQAP